ncbi:hypothetical protein ACSQ67_025995 [Phaseolus vulgaris]
MSAVRSWPRWWFVSWRTVVRGLGCVVGGCDGYDGESRRDSTPSRTTTDGTPVTPILKASTGSLRGGSIF